MPRRKRWLLMVLLCLAALCWLAWAYSERPPFRFLTGSQLVYMDKDFSENGAREWRKIYASPDPAAKLLAKASNEIPDSNADDEGGGYCLTDDGEFLVSIEPLDASQSADPLFPSGTRSRIVVDFTNPSTLDRFRVWLFGISRKNPRP